jgi:hypothetical protein
MRSDRARHATAEPGQQGKLRPCVHRRYLQHRDPIETRDSQECPVKPLDPSVRHYSTMAVLSIIIGPMLPIKRRKIRGRSRYISVLLRDRDGKPFTCTLFSLS